MDNKIAELSNVLETNIVFSSREHKEFCIMTLSKCRYQDVYHSALCYCLGISKDTRNHADRIYDFKSGCIKPDCLHDGWQTGTSRKVVRLAFNLYTNGTPSVYEYDREEEQLTEYGHYTVEDIFCCS